MTQARIHVMAAVIRRDGRILIARRPDSAHQGGLWEFPGGKLDAGEERSEGLRRELREELGIEVTSTRPLIDIRHDYPDKSVRLDVWLVDDFQGEAHGAEGQPILWVTPAELDQYAFPQANVPIITAARLPERYLITPDYQDMTQLVTGLENAREQGITPVQLRQTQLDEAQYHQLAQQLLDRFGDDFIWLLKGNEPPAFEGAGWHLTALQVRALHDAGWCKGKPFAAGPPGREEAAVWNGLLAASCHDAQELQMAADIGVDFVTLSPVLPTQSHPGAQHLGWNRAAELVALTNLPAYLLGGLTPHDLQQAQRIGAQGIAGISGLWNCEPDRRSVE